MRKRRRGLAKAVSLALAGYLLFWCVPYLIYLPFGGVQPGDIWHAEVEIGCSERFSPLETRLAMSSAAMLVYGFPGSTLKRLRYDEERCNSELGKGDSNQILLLCDFETGDASRVEGLDPSTGYDWQVRLHRLNRFCPWFIQSYGHA